MVLELRRPPQVRAACTRGVKMDVGSAGPRLYGCEIRSSAKRVLIFLVAAALGSLLTFMTLGCSSEPSNTPQPEPTVAPFDAREVLQAVVTELSELESGAFVLEHLKGSTDLIPGLVVMHKASGVVAIPDRVRITVEGETVLPRSFVEVGVVTIGDQAYMTDFITGKWQEVAIESLPFVPRNLGLTLADIVKAVEQPTLVGLERRMDMDTHHIQGRVQSQALAGLVPGAGQGFEVKLDLWLEESSHFLLQALIWGMVVPTDQPDTLRQLTLSDINVPVEISPPE